MNITQNPVKRTIIMLYTVYHFEQNMEMKNKYFIENKLKNVT